LEQANEEIKSRLSEKALAENERSKKALLEACATEQSVLVVGAGLSNRAGYPLWSPLLEQLRGLVDSLSTDCNAPFIKSQEAEDDDLAYADELRHYIEIRANVNRYYGFLHDTFKPNGGYDPLHDQLMALPFLGIVTTNYDPLLDDALRRQYPEITDTHFVVDHDHIPDLRRFIANLRKKNLSNRQIAHLHGRYDMPSRTILTKSDYRRIYDSRFDESQKQRLLDIVNYKADPAETIQHIETILPGWTLHRKFLWSLLSSRSAVFLGFGMKDPYFLEMLKTVTDDLWLWNDPAHFAIMPRLPNDDTAAQRALQFRSKYGVAVVFYDIHDGNHTAVETLIQDMSSACGITPRPTVPLTPEPGQVAKVNEGRRALFKKINEQTRQHSRPL
jgi:hypothetical protein